MTPGKSGLRGAALSALALILLLTCALLLRLPALENRPMHADEAVHALKFNDLWTTGDYRYDPHEFHGPTLYYATLPIVALRGRRSFASTTAADYRLAPALIGAAILLLMPLLADGLGGRGAALAAAALFAVSPAFVFYSDYYIQEAPFVCFTVCALACGWRYRQSGRIGWALGAGVFAGLTIATKETAVLTLAAALLAIGLARATRPEAAKNGAAPPRLLPLLIAVGALVALLVAVLLLSDHLRRPAAALDYLRSFAPWANRGAATDLHRHAPGYYLGILLLVHPTHRSPYFSEVFIVLLALVGSVMAFRPPTVSAGDSTGSDNSLLRFLVFYTLLQLLAYSVIPYKTPWCVLDILAGLILLAGAGAVAALRAVSQPFGRVVVTVILAAGIVQLAWQAHRDANALASDPRNPYVYAATAPEVSDLASRLQALAAASPDRDRLVIQVCSIDGYYWPLPWYLRGFSKVGYWTGVPTRDKTPLESASIVLGSLELDDALNSRLSGTHLMTGYFGLRQGVPIEVWVRSDLWRRYLKTRPVRSPSQ